MSADPLQSFRSALHNHKKSIQRQNLNSVVHTLAKAVVEAVTLSMSNSSYTTHGICTYFLDEITATGQEQCVLFSTLSELPMTGAPQTRKTSLNVYKYDFQFKHTAEAGIQPRYTCE